MKRIRWKNAFLAAAVILLAALAWFYFSSIVNVVFASIVLAYLLNLAVRPIEAHMARWKAITLVLSVVLLAVSVVLLIAVPSIFRELRLLIENIGQYEGYIDSFISNISAFAERFSFSLPFGRMRDALFEWIYSFISKIPTETIPGILVSLPTLLLTPVLTVYFVSDKEYFSDRLMYLIPQGARAEVRKLGSRLNRDLGRYLRGQLIVTCIHSVMGTVALFLCGIPFALLLGIFFGLCNIVPYFGPIVGAVVIVFTALPSGLGKALLALAVTTCLQQIDNAFITPKVMGSAIGIHPVLVLVSVVAFGQLFGMAGLLLSVPILIFIQKLSEAIFEYRLRANAPTRAIE